MIGSVNADAALWPSLETIEQNLAGLFPVANAVSPTVGHAAISVTIAPFGLDGAVSQRPALCSIKYFSNGETGVPKRDLANFKARFPEILPTPMYYTPMIITPRIKFRPSMLNRRRCKMVTGFFDVSLEVVDEPITAPTGSSLLSSSPRRPPP